MTDNDLSRLGRRIEEYSDEGASLAPEPRTSFTDSKRRTLWPMVSALATALVASVVALAVFSVVPRAPIGLATPDASASAFETGPASPSASSPTTPLASDPPTESPAEPSEPPPSSNTPEASIPGEVPASGAPHPSGPSPLGDTTIYEIYEAVTANGFPCESHHSDPLGGDRYSLGCTANEDGVSYSVVTFYWTPDYLTNVHAGVVSAGAAPIDSARAIPLFEGLVRAVVDGPAEDDAVAWMLDHLNDSSCGNFECRYPLENGEIAIAVGMNGARSLDFGPRRDQ